MSHAGPTTAALALAGSTESDAAPRPARLDSAASSGMIANEHADVNWGRVFAEVVAVLAPVVGAGDVREVAQEGMSRVFLGDAPARRDGESVGGHVARAGLQAWRTAQRSGRWRRSELVSTRIAKSLPEPAPTAEAVLSMEEEHARRLTGLIEAIGDDQEAADIVRLLREGVATEADQVAGLGISLEAVRNARKRLKRHVEAVNAREQREREQAQETRSPSPPRARQS